MFDIELADSLTSLFLYVCACVYVFMDVSCVSLVGRAQTGRIGIRVEGGEGEKKQIGDNIGSSQGNHQREQA